MWYFSRDKGTVRNRTFLKAISMASFYHTGTAAFGSMIIALVKTVRAVILYFERQARRTSDNSVAKAVFKCLRCCLCMAEKCIKFISKNAFVQTAIHGHSFCTASKEAFLLITANAIRISAISIVSEILLFAMKTFIVLSSTIAGYMYIDYHYDTELHGLYVVTVVILIISMCTAEMFQQVLFMSISTIIQCFIADEVMFEVSRMFLTFIKRMFNIFSHSIRSLRIDLLQVVYRK